MTLKNTFDKYKDLLKFLALSYLDKFFIFIIPLIIISIFNEEHVYNVIEYTYSIAILVQPIMDIGLTSYSFYGYKNSTDREGFLITLRSNFYKLFSVYGTIVLIYTTYCLLFQIENDNIFIPIRSLFVFATMFLTSYYRLIDKPSYSLLVTLFSSTLAILIFAVAYLMEIEVTLWLFFIAPSIVCFVIFLIAIKNLLELKKATSSSSFFKKSITFYWPIAISTFVFMGIANFGKIYGLENFVAEDMSYLAIVQRFSMLIHIAHSSALAFIMKKIFIDTGTFNIPKSLVKKYSAFIMTSSVLVMLMLKVFSIFYPGFAFKFDSFTFLIIGYTIVWCHSSLLEAFFNKANLTLLRLFIVLFNALLFISTISLNLFEPLLNIAFAMFGSTLAGLIVSIIILKRKNFIFS